MMQPQPYPQGPPPDAAKVKTRTWLWILAVVVALAIGYGAGSTQQGTAEPSGTPAASEGEPRSDEPAADIADGFCDLLLFTSGDQSEFAASADVVNVGNIGVEVNVVAEFDQLGRDDYVLAETVKVKVGETKTVNLSELIDMSTASRHQDGGYDCRVRGELLDTFGKPE